MVVVAQQAGDDSYISLPVGAGGTLALNVMPIQMISPITTPIVDDAEETDPSTLAGDFDPEDGDTSDEEEEPK